MYDRRLPPVLDELAKQRRAEILVSFHGGHADLFRRSQLEADARFIPQFRDGTRGPQWLLLTSRYEMSRVVVMGASVSGSLHPLTARRISNSLDTRVHLPFRSPVVSISLWRGLNGVVGSWAYQ